jgi:hypothetical protein
MVSRTRLFVSVIVFVVLILSLLAGAHVGAQDQDPPVSEQEIPPITEFLAFIASPAGAVIVGAVVSMYLERWDWYNAQGAEPKRLIAYGLTALVAIAAYVLVTYVPSSFWNTLAPYWVIAAFTAFSIFGNQGWFQLAIRRSKAQVAINSGESTRWWIEESPDGAQTINIIGGEDPEIVNQP